MAAQAEDERLRVLVIDDEESICELVARVARAAGNDAVTATSAAEAREAMASGTFDVVLTDVVLGPADGLDLLAELRAGRPRLGAVVMSGYSPAPERLAALAIHGVEFVPKPFGNAQLVTALRRATSLARGRPLGGDAPRAPS